ncbi:hypothetical protein FJ976_01620 [Mesorhizobium sp. B1-1-9]|uniref:phage tail protein n=1 Tax=Mesorhizobium sp. B1-1-9 TaxID=2589975 RepID=UPI00112E6F97|nr:hypothetical protein [Mesorhizobium sp. B1-1-9]TPN58634.1 hypothetical protein FJ976_01620 [Mesorhizobium sp. B1-1-9]
MSILWEPGLSPWIDPNGDPYSGLKAFFYDSGTLTPLVTYTTAGLSTPNPFPVPADSAGQFPPIFLPEQIQYHLRIQTAGGVTLRDIDNISAPTTVVPDPPSGGTATEFLLQTGHLISAWRASTPDGFVRCNGRTIGNATSGATERANADTSALFQFLWTEDANLAVSGGRGATAVGDYAASKTIALPDLRGRALFGLDGMGGASAGRIINGDTTGGSSNVLGGVGGENRHALITAELAAHGHSVTVADPGHNHNNGVFNRLLKPPYVGSLTGNDQDGSGTEQAVGTGDGAAILSNTTGITAVANNTGSGTAHNNMPPFAQVQFFIKL